MIWFDNVRSVRTASYYVQQLFSHNKGTHTASLIMDGKPIAGNADQAGLFASAVYDSQDGAFVVKTANVSDTAQVVSIALRGLKPGLQIKSYSVTSLHSDDLDADNTLDNPDAVVPQVKECRQVGGDAISLRIEPKTFYVFRIKVG